ncbi:hypothetical protein ACFVFS_34635 [Kitasatospora sp. NPDC057692]|uniref:hypothetical protein n=1 Tax=Kitasatospora sp. NPDC057692 TaxID=3346215 RepID=UPI0036B37984
MTATPGLPPLGDLALGFQLRHLRACQNRTPGDIAHTANRLAPDAPPFSLREVQEVEAGRGRVLREAAAAGRLGAFLGAYDTGLVALADIHHAATEAARTDLGRSWSDDGPGAPHRYQLLERAAESLLLAAVTAIPAPSRTHLASRALVLEEPDGPATAAALEPRTLAPGGCAVCRIYRADLLVDGGPVLVWRQALVRARKTTFDQRILRPGADTVLLLAEDLLHPEHSVLPVGVHADQISHLAYLVRTTRLKVRVQPRATGTDLRFDTTELVLNGRTVTASPDDTLVDYLDGQDTTLHQAVENSHGPQDSIRLLEKAATGTLRRGGRSPW